MSVIVVVLLVIIAFAVAPGMMGALFDLGLRLVGVAVMLAVAGFIYLAVT